MGSIPAYGRSPGGGSHPSILARKNPWTEDPGGLTVHTVTKSQIRRKQLRRHPPHGKQTLDKNHQQKLKRHYQRKRNMLLDEQKDKGKVRRLRQAKEEAMAETDQYRMQRDEEFRQKQAKIMGSQSNVLEEIEVQTLGKIKELNASYSMSMEGVINELLSIVCDVKPEIHVNYRITA
ncbi:V-type proton ATPase subunit G 3 isoform X1 [Bos taurus]|uniref:V-type proton ATPase subunit G n=1 Tax=Bos indicus x Bos taurus TaxID=30522 RepID=A0A4W2CLN6_BOBOX|nr:V-type proton ATPase subunit G 3 isoform X1 [Bos taurus]